jgi:hypothetical protein
MAASKQQVSQPAELRVRVFPAPVVDWRRVGHEHVDALRTRIDSIGKKPHGLNVRPTRLRLNEGDERLAE